MSGMFLQVRGRARHENLGSAGQDPLRHLFRRGSAVVQQESARHRTRARAGIRAGDYRASRQMALRIRRKSM
jgi:hypothetical protein